jgi:hypothetical protein
MGEDMRYLLIALLIATVAEGSRVGVYRGHESAQLRRAVQLWTPADTTTKLWIDFADTSTLTLDGSLITQVDDKSGEDLHFGGTPSLNLPVLTNSINNLTVAKLDGSNSFFGTTSTSTWKFLHDGTKYRIWIVSRTEVDAFQRIFGTGPFSQNIPGAAISARGDSATGQIDLDAGRNSAGAYQARAANENHYPLQQWNMNSFFVDLSNATATNRIGARLNAGTVSRTNTQTASPSTSNPAFSARIGSERDGSTIRQYLTGSVAEIIIILGDEDGALDDKVWGYLAHKWGLEDNLPSDHPYKSKPPTK